VPDPVIKATSVTAHDLMTAQGGMTSARWGAMHLLTAHTGCCICACSTGRCTWSYLRACVVRFKAAGHATQGSPVAEVWEHEIFSSCVTHPLLPDATAECEHTTRRSIIPSFFHPPVGNKKPRRSALSASHSGTPSAAQSIGLLTTALPLSASFSCSRSLILQQQNNTTIQYNSVQACNG
jgi:hypothetical protein